MSSLFQREILNASDACSNCYRRQRREAVRPRTYEPDEIYSERVRSQTTVEDVPGPVASEAGHLFCSCGAEGAHTRIWTADDVDRARLQELLVALLETLGSKGYRVDERHAAEVALAHYETLRSPEYGPFQDPAEYDARWRRTPDGMNDVFTAAVAAGVSDPVRPSASTD